MKSAQMTDKTIVSKRIVPQPPARRPQPESMRLNTAQRQTVRVALATGATIAALIGAQTLALLDRSAIVKPIALSRSVPGTAAPASQPLITNPTASGSLDMSGAFGGTPTPDSGSSASLDMSGAFDAPTTDSSAANNVFYNNPYSDNNGQPPAYMVMPTVVPDGMQPMPLTTSS